MGEAFEYFVGPDYYFVVFDESWDHSESFWSYYLTKINQSANHMNQLVKASNLIEILKTEIINEENQKDIIFPRAKCLYHLGQLDEARKLCSILRNQLSDSRAEQLLTRINSGVVSMEASFIGKRASGGAAFTPFDECIVHRGSPAADRCWRT